MPADDDALDILSLAEDYFRPEGRIEFVRFASRLAALVWLHRSLAAALRDGVAGLRALKTSGKHLNPAFWGHDEHDSVYVGAGEYDLALDESLGTLEGEAAPMCGGAIILSGTSALESLTTDLLDQPQDSSLHRAGLKRKIAELCRRWADHIDGDTLADNIDWLAERRNAFAHSFIDGAGPWPRTLPPGRFGTDEVEEALRRIGQAAYILESGWERHLTAQGR